MVNPFSFSNIPIIHFGVGKFNQLYPVIENTRNKILIFTGKQSYTKIQQWTDLIEFLNKQSIVFDHVSVTEEPSPEFIDQISKNFNNEFFDFVISIGGGSVIDAGKAVSAMLKLNESVFDYLEGIGNSKVHPGVKIPFIAIPTTSGTGSEATKNAVLNRIGPNGFKRSLRHNNLIPDIAIIDPRLTINCPTDISAACGLDAFTQLLESFVSTKANTITDVLALSGIAQIRNSLVRACKNGDDIDTRTGMSYASLISGITLANAGLGVVHGFASSIGGLHHIPHGVVCGTLLGSSTRINIIKLQTEKNNETALKKYSEVGKLLSGTPNKDDEFYLNSLIETIDYWTKTLHIPKLSKYGINEEEIEKIVEQTGIKNNPVELNQNDLRCILHERL
ncbi:iron-containing alcohol dehydrogenase [Bacteroidota bacterium]